MQNQKISGYINLAKRGNFVVAGVDNIKADIKNCKLFIIGDTIGKSVEKLILNHKEINTLQLKANLSELINYTNCQIIAIKNESLAIQIEKSFKEEN